jgi:hypothetical protein
MDKLQRAGSDVPMAYSPGTGLRAIFLSQGC